MMVPSIEMFSAAKLNLNLIFKGQITSISYCGTHQSRKISQSIHRINLSFVNLTVFHFCSKLISWVYLWRNSANCSMAWFFKPWLNSWDIYLYEIGSHRPYGLSGEPVVVKLTGNLILLSSNNLLRNQISNPNLH